MQQDLRDVKSASKSVLIIGSGPAGLFAALTLNTVRNQTYYYRKGKRYPGATPRPRPPE
ncbi:MAG: hypothetical protein WDM78_22795 [Puia sp.]